REPRPQSRAGEGSGVLLRVLSWLETASIEVRGRSVLERRTDFGGRIARRSRGYRKCRRRRSLLFDRKVKEGPEPFGHTCAVWQASVPDCETRRHRFRT